MAGQTPGPERRGESKLGELLHFPERRRPWRDAVLPGEPDAVRVAERTAFAAQPHDRRIDYEPPNPKLVMPQPTLTLELLGVILALVSFVLLAALMFYRWMEPSQRSPSQPNSQPGVQQKLP